MGRRDSSDSDSSYHHRHKKSKKKYSRSRSRSSSEESYKKSRSRRRSRSRSRSHSRRSRSRDRRSRSRSRDRRSRSRSRDRNRSRHRRRSRSTSQDRSRHRRSHSKERRTKSAYSAPSSPSGKKQETIKINHSESDLKNMEIDPLTLYKPTTEQLEKFEKESFVQQKFSASFNPQQLPPTKKKKKKKKQQQQRQQQQLIQKNLEQMEIDKTKTSTISHEDAIFGTSAESFQVSKFIGGFSEEKTAKLNLLEREDSIFGALFYEDELVRKKRWFKKLAELREKNRIIPT